MYIHPACVEVCEIIRWKLVFWLRAKDSSFPFSEDDIIYGLESITSGALR